MVAKRFVGVTPPFEVAFSRDEDTFICTVTYCNVIMHILYIYIYLNIHILIICL